MQRWTAENSGVSTRAAKDKPVNTSRNLNSAVNGRKSPPQPPKKVGNTQAAQSQPKTPKTGQESGAASESRTLDVNDKKRKAEDSLEGRVQKASKVLFSPARNCFAHLDLLVKKPVAETRRLPKPKEGVKRMRIPGVIETLSVTPREPVEKVFNFLDHLTTTTSTDGQDLQRDGAQSCIKDATADAKEEEKTDSSATENNSQIATSTNPTTGKDLQHDEAQTCIEDATVDAQEEEKKYINEIEEAESTLDFETPRNPTTGQHSQHEEAQDCIEDATEAAKEEEKIYKQDVEEAKPSGEQMNDPAAEQAKAKIPRGLTNHSLACFANASLQCLFGVPELAENYQTWAFATRVEIKSIIDAFEGIDRRQELTPEVKEHRQLVWEVAEKHEADM